MCEFDLEERETQKVEEIAQSIKMQWGGYFFVVNNNIIGSVS